MKNTIRSIFNLIQYFINHNTHKTKPFYIDIAARTYLQVELG